jgi:hypothetical protein
MCSDLRSQNPPEAHMSPDRYNLHGLTGAATSSVCESSLSTSLAATGCRVRSATSGLELLKKARRRLPDWIILDAALADMDGTTAYEILSRLPSVGTILKGWFLPVARGRETIVARWGEEGLPWLE